MLFPQYIERLKKQQEQSSRDYILRDSLETYKTFKDFLAYLGQDDTDRNILVMQTYAPNILTEFFCKLPNAHKTCEYFQEHTDSNKLNDSANLLLNLDLIIVEAWYQSLISIPRHDAAVLLEKRMKDFNITMAAFPQACVSQAQKDWIWNRTLVSHNILGTEAISQSELRSNFDTRISKGKFCSVNATATLKVDKFRALFDDCEFQSQFLLERSLKNGTLNHKWEELGCDKIE